MSLALKSGMVLKHKSIPQKIEVVSRVDLGGTVFWEVKEYDRYGARRPWMIVEPLLVDQYEPVEEKSP